MTRKTAAVFVPTVLALLALVLVPATLAAKGGNAGATGKPVGGGSSTSSLTLVPMDGATQAAHYGRVTFAVSTTATDRPFVRLHCWQGSTGVYNATIGIFPTYMFDPWLTLDSSYWTAGVEANCTATAYYYDRRGNQKVLATMSFSVAP